MTNGREMTPPLVFSTPPHISNINTNERPPVNTTVFVATTPGNKPFAYRASSLTIPTPMISPAFIEANYKILKSILRDRQRQICNKGKEAEPEGISRVTDLQKLEERKMEVHNIKQREGESVRAFATRYTYDTLLILGLHEDQRIFGFVHGLRTRNLIEHLSIDLPSTYTGLMEKTYTWIEAREVATNGALNDRRDNFERLLSRLSKSPRKIFAIEKVARSFEQPPRMLGNRQSRDMSKYCYFYEDHGHDTNDYRQLRSQIKEAMKSSQLSHLVKGIKKERETTSDNQRGEKKEKITTPAEAPILMINKEEACIRNNISKSPTIEGMEITFVPVTKGSNSSTPVVIKAKIFIRKTYIQASKVDSQVLLVGFLGGKSQAIGEVLLEITIGDTPLSRSETLNFVIVRSNSPYNMLLGRTIMPKIGLRKKNTKLEETKPNYEWKLYTDEASCSDSSGAGLMLIDPKAPPKINTAIKEIYEGSYGFNTVPHSMVVMITKQAYYWPSMHKDFARIIQDCEKCKEQSAVRKGEEIKTITARNAWSSSHWGISILGPLPTAPGEYVVCRLGVPQIISSKDDKHFKEGIFRDLCRGLKITQSLSPITEHMEIISRIEKQLTRRQRGWVDDLPQYDALPRSWLFDLESLKDIVFVLGEYLERLGEG
nr:hypothetical protein [Tanacetum cinerariifolium]